MNRQISVLREGRGVHFHREMRSDGESRTQVDWLRAVNNMSGSREFPILDFPAVLDYQKQRSILTGRELAPKPHQTGLPRLGRPTWLPEKPSFRALPHAYRKRSR